MSKEIPFGRPLIEAEEKQAVMNVLEGHILTHGPLCTEFEQKFTDFVGGGKSVTTSSCMAALHLATMKLGLTKGDEVLVPAQTHVATVHAVELVGARPVFVDCELATGNIDLDLLERSVTEKTRAIMLVHFAGIPINMQRVMQIAKKHDLKVIEDCALAVGATFADKHVGLWGDIGCFSFYPVKHMTTGEGGMLISKDEELAEEIAKFRAFNVDRKHNERKLPGFYEVCGLGLNYRMSEMQAALGVCQVDKLPRILHAREENFRALKSNLEDIQDLTVLDSCELKQKNSFYCMTVVFNNKTTDERNSIIESLKQQNIGCSIYYPQPVPLMKYYRDKYNAKMGDYSNAQKISFQSIALPVGPHLQVADMQTIADGLRKAI